MDHRQTFQTINQAILASSRDLKGRYQPGRFPDWYGKTLSDIALLLDGDPIALADTIVESHDDSAGKSTITIRVFTDDLMVTTVANVTGEPVVSRVTTVRSRAGLRRLGIEAGGNALSPSWPDEWPGWVQLRLEYDDGESFNLPASPSASGEQGQRVVDFLPSLRADLHRR